MLAAMASGSRRHDQPLHQLPHAAEAVAGVVGEAVLLPSRLLQPAVLPDAEVLQSKRQALAPRRDTCRPSALLGHLRAR